MKNQGAMVITNIRVLFPPAKVTGRTVSYKFPFPREVEIQADRADELIESMYSADIFPAQENIFVMALVEHLSYLVAPLYAYELVKPFSYAQHDEEGTSLFTLSLMEYSRTLYDTSFHPLDLEFPLEEMLSRVDYLSGQKEGQVMLRAIHDEYRLALSMGYADGLRCITKISAANKKKRDEVLAYIAAHS